MIPTPDIQRHRDALLRLVAMLFGVPGVETGGTATLSKALRRTVLFYLRPMESATVRLIAVMASALKLDGYAVPNLRQSRGKPITDIPKSNSLHRVPAFSLFDRVPSNGTGEPRLKYAKHAPCISFFDSTDPARTLRPEEPRPRYDGLIDSTRVARRLVALQAALGDLGKQAKRLLRSQARRAAARKPVRSPIRRGKPPGHRARCRWEIDEILRDCHQLALTAMTAPDTS